MRTLLKVLILLFITLFFVGVMVRNPTWQAYEGFGVRASEERIHNDLQVLTRVQPPRNFSNPQSLNEVANYIHGEFSRVCERVEWQVFTANQNEYRNVVCHFAGENRGTIVIGAHYDVADVQPGADDNASGTSGILELVRLIRESGKLPRHDLEIVAYTLEEPPFFRTEEMGSAVHARSLSERKVDVKFMISVEMIGYFTDEVGSQGFPIPLLYLFYPARGNFIALVGGLKEYLPIRELKRRFSAATDLPLYSINAPSLIPGVDYSDHLNYWNLGYPAYMMTDTSFYRNANYHKPTDTIETLDLQRMARVVDGLFGIIQ